ncbi:OPT oligopeptide transporter protein-domain-containing protein [Lentinula edodes]|nr:OPT oligopeptide transporter protein-domain-containing protein [Lentinula edodes]
MDTDVLTKGLGKGSEALEYLGSENKALDDNESDSKEDIEEYGVFEDIFHGDIVLTDSFCSSDENNDPAAAMIPQIVRELVDFEDDPTMPVITWRFFFLSGTLTALGAWLTQMGFFRTTYVPYSIYFVQIAALYFGRMLASTLPQKQIGLGRFSFELNPGPFSIKEHVAIVLAANTGAMNNLGDYVLAPLQIFYDKRNFWFNRRFDILDPQLSCVFVGFSFASFARVFLVENPTTPYVRLSLQQVAVFNAMRQSIEEDAVGAQKQMRVFWWFILGFFLWQFLPEYAFPFVSSLAFLCWFSKNPKAQFLGSGLGGAGFLTVTLDWSNIGSQCVYYPYWAQVNIFASSVIAAWILIPVAFFTNAWDSAIYPIQSQALYLRNGSVYPTADLITASYGLNETLFEEIGPPLMSAQLRWNYFAAYVAYLGSFVSCALFQGPNLWRTFKTYRQAKPTSNDRLTEIIRRYPAVPIWWNFVLFIVPVIILIILTAKGVLYMPIYMLFIGLAIGAVIVLPMAFIYSVSGYQMQVGYFNELFYGYAINAGGSRHPVGALSYRVISGQCWYEAQSMLADMKLGHYFHIPPRKVLLAQIWGICVGVPVNYATILWVCQTKGDILKGLVTDPNRQWTGQTVISLNNQSISFALVGPKRLFADAIYTPMLYGFLVGAVAPCILYLLHRKWPRARFDLWSIPVFFDNFENYYGNISVYFFTLFMLGTLNHLWVKRYYYAFWKKYAYLCSAAADTGYNFNLLIIFVAFSAAKTIPMANWWGNNAQSVERCRSDLLQLCPPNFTLILQASTFRRKANEPDLYL